MTKSISLRNGCSGSSLFCLLFVLGHCDHLGSCCDWYGLYFRFASRSIFPFRFLNFCVLSVQGQYKNREKYSTERYSDIIVLTFNFARGIFYQVLGIWGGVVLTIRTFFKAKNNIIEYFSFFSYLEFELTPWWYIIWLLCIPLLYSHFKGWHNVKG